MVVDTAGAVLSGRTAGALFRERVEQLASQHPVVVVDFTGVEIATPGFADELFARMSARLVDAGRVRFAHLDPDLNVLRELVIAQRMRVESGAA